MGDYAETAGILDRPLVLIGMMGVGKSHLARRMARALGFRFYDTDKLIEERAGRPVAEIFTQDGEAKFRDSEVRVMTELLEMGPSVIAAGGGLVTNPGMIDTLRKTAVTVWVRAPVEDVMTRLRASPHVRPLLQTADPEGRLRTLLAERTPLYSQADFVVENGEGRDPAQILHDAMSALRTFLKAKA